MPLVKRTRATLRSAEFGFFGVVVYTRVHTPRRCGAATFFLRPLPDLRPGVASFFLGGVRPLRTNWLVVGMRRATLAGAPQGAVSILWRRRRTVQSRLRRQAATPRASAPDPPRTPTRPATGAYVT